MGEGFDEGYRCEFPPSLDTTTEDEEDVDTCEGE